VAEPARNGTITMIGGRHACAPAGAASATAQAQTRAERRVEHDRTCECPEVNASSLSSPVVAKIHAIPDRRFANSTPCVPLTRRKLPFDED
jgi:hypothetical protein